MRAQNHMESMRVCADCKNGASSCRIARQCFASLVERRTRTVKGTRDLAKAYITFVLRFRSVNFGRIVARTPLMSNLRRYFSPILKTTARASVRGLLTRTGMVKRKASTAKSKVTLEDFDDVKAQMLADVKCTMDRKWRTSH